MQDGHKDGFGKWECENVYVCWCPWLLCCYVIIFRVWQYSRARKSIHLVLSSPHAIFSNSVDHATLSYSLHHIRAHQIHQTKLTTSGSIFFSSKHKLNAPFPFCIYTESVICPEPPRTGLVSPLVSVNQAEEAPKQIRKYQNTSHWAHMSDNFIKKCVSRYILRTAIDCQIDAVH